jgi:hypothetical protein
MKLVHFGKRFYDPDLGRWTQPDMLDQPADLRQANLYLYVGQDPVNLIDPSGMSPRGRGCFNQYGGSGCYNWVTVETPNPGVTWTDLDVACGVGGGADAGRNAADRLRKAPARKSPWGAIACGIYGGVRAVTS